MIQNGLDKCFKAEANRGTEEKSCLWAPTDFKYKLTDIRNVDCKEIMDAFELQYDRNKQKIISLLISFLREQE
jgi:hypothetical protein